MKIIKLIIFLLLATTAGNQLSAQAIKPDTTVRKDKEKIKECNDMIEYIRIWAYYDENDDLIFLHYMGGCNCDDTEESYWISEGKILDFEGSYSCGCCEDDEYEKEKDSRHPVIGSPLKNSIFYENYSLEHFLRADSLLKALKKTEEETVMQ